MPITKQSGPMAEVLAEARAPEGEDWALVWTEEELESERVIEERAGWFSTVEREVFALDPFAGRGAGYRRDTHGAQHHCARNAHIRCWKKEPARLCIGAQVCGEPGRGACCSI